MPSRLLIFYLENSLDNHKMFARQSSKKFRTISNNFASELSHCSLSTLDWSTTEFHESWKKKDTLSSILLEVEKFAPISQKYSISYANSLGNSDVTEIHHLLIIKDWHKWISNRRETIWKILTQNLKHGISEITAEN